MCVSTVYSVLSRTLWTKPQSFYSGVIRTHDICDSRAVSLFGYQVDASLILSEARSSYLKLEQIDVVMLQTIVYEDIETLFIL